jgi:protein phosphatase
MSDATILHWDSASRTDVGSVRKLNEDAVLERVERGIWAVADGMGGHAAGDFASAAVVDALAAISGTPGLGSLVSQARERLEEVNRSLGTEARQRGQEMIGTTVVVLMLHGHHGVTLWAGDSRAYRYREGELTRLTRDHSQVEEFVSQGLLTRQQAEKHPASNIITRAIGVADQLELDSRMFELAPGDSFLLCSDGLYRELGDDEISACLAMDDCHQACDALIDRALAGGARDNVSVVVVRVLDADQVTRTRYNPSVTAASADTGGRDDPTVC